MANPLNQVPASLEPIGMFGDKNIPVRVSAVWYQFFLSLSSLVQNVVNGVLAYTVSVSVTATGTVQADAKALKSEWNVVSVTPVNSGVKLQNVGAGVPSTVFNRGVNTLKVYPPLGGTIDALGVNVAYSLATVKQQSFSQVSATQWFSTQLG